MRRKTEQTCMVVVLHHTWPEAADQEEPAARMVVDIIPGKYFDQLRLMKYFLLGGVTAHRYQTAPFAA